MGKKRKRLFYKIIILDIVDILNILDILDILDIFDIIDIQKTCLLKKSIHLLMSRRLTKISSAANAARFIWIHIRCSTAVVRSASVVSMNCKIAKPTRP
jgi:hypothetical protein